MSENNGTAIATIQFSNHHHNDTKDGIKRTVHHVPCTIHHSGVASVEKLFSKTVLAPGDRTTSVSGSSVLEELDNVKLYCDEEPFVNTHHRAMIRGRPIVGELVQLPNGVQGFIIEQRSHHKDDLDDNLDNDVDEGDGDVDDNHPNTSPSVQWETRQQFSEIMNWCLDKSPSDHERQINGSLDWMHMARIVRVCTAPHITPPTKAH